MKKYCDGPGALFFCVVFIAGCVSVNPQFKAGYDHFKQGSERLQSNQCSQAVEDFTKAINLYSIALSAPQNFAEGPAVKTELAATYSGRSACYKKLGKLDMALEDQKNTVRFYKEVCQHGSQGLTGMEQAMIQEHYQGSACQKVPEAELVLENLKKEAPQTEAGQSQGSGGKSTQSTLQDILKELEKEE